MTQKSFRILLVASVIALTGIPYLAARIASSDATVFTGSFVFHDDFNFYMSCANQAARGQWLFSNQFTPEAHHPASLNIEWLLVGKLSSITCLPPQDVFQLLRIFSIAASVLLFDWIAALLLQSLLYRRVALAMFCFGGGFSWIGYIPGLETGGLERLLVDNVAGLHPFFSFLLQPHFAFATALSLLSIGCLMRAEVAGKPLYNFMTPAALLLLGLVRPFDLLPVLGLLMLCVAREGILRHRGWRRRVVKSGAIALCGPVPVLGYYLWLYRFHPVFQWHSIQNVVPPPPPIVLLLSMGLVSCLLLGYFLTVIDVGERSQAGRLLVMYVASITACLYSYPVLTFSGQVSTAVVPPAILLGVLFLDRHVPVTSAKRKIVIGTLMFGVGINSLASLTMTASQSWRAARGAGTVAKERVEAFQWLFENADENDVVMGCSYAIDNQLGRYTRSRSYSGYRFSTVRWKQKENIRKRMRSVAEFTKVLEELVDRYGVEYYVSDDSQTWGFEQVLQQMQLHPVFSNGVVTIYRVGVNSPIDIGVCDGSGKARISGVRSETE